MPRGDFKSINCFALDMFQCGHVHEIKIGYEKYIYMQAKCWAEMKKNIIYKISLCFDADVYDVMDVLLEKDLLEAVSILQQSAMH